MESDEEQPEVQPAQSFVVHLSRDLGEPIIEATEDREHDRSDDHVVKMCDNEVGGAELPIEGRRAQHDPGETGNQELEKKSNAEQHRCFELDLASPHGSQPVEDLDSSGNRNRHCRQYEK